MRRSRSTAVTGSHFTYHSVLDSILHMRIQRMLKKIFYSYVRTIFYFFFAILNHTYIRARAYRHPAVFIFYSPYIKLHINKMRNMIKIDASYLTRIDFIENHSECSLLERKTGNRFP